jgi:hypothetical protein
LLLAYAHETSPSSAEKNVLRLGYYAAHNKHVRAFLDVDEFYTTITITLDARSVLLLLLNNSDLKILAVLFFYQ